MKSVKEVNEMRREWINSAGNERGVDNLFDLVVGITERLEAMDTQKKPCINGTLCVRQDGWCDVSCRVKKEAMIEALQWAVKHAVTEYHTCVARAIVRVDAGGEL